MVFFFKQKTAYEMRISDWSSDVCSSDLFREEARQTPAHIVELCRDRRDQRRFSRLIVRIDEFGIDEQRHDTGREIVAPIALDFQHTRALGSEIGRELEALFVQVGGSEIGCGFVAETIGVIALAAGQTPAAGIMTGRWP